MFPPFLSVLGPSLFPKHSGHLMAFCTDVSWLGVFFLQVSAELMCSLLLDLAEILL